MSFDSPTTLPEYPMQEYTKFTKTLEVVHINAGSTNIPADNVDEIDEPLNFHDLYYQISLRIRTICCSIPYPYSIKAFKNENPGYEELVVNNQGRISRIMCPRFNFKNEPRSMKLERHPRYVEIEKKEHSMLNFLARNCLVCGCDTLWNGLVCGCYTL